MTSLRKLLEDRCGVDVTTRSRSADVPDADEDAISLLPLSLLRTGRPSGRRAALEARLRVLALPAGTNALSLLGRMLVAVDGASGIECESKELPAEAWLALGLSLRPALVVSAPVVLELDAPDVPEVRRPLVTTVAVSSLRRGVLLGPGDIPLVGARVWADSNDEPARTDAQGRFQVLVTEQSGVDHRLVIHFKDHALTGQLPAADSADAPPAVIRFEQWEGTT